MLLLTPHCPAGHLPHKGGEWLSPRLSPISNVAEGEPSARQAILPLVGEMSGRTVRGKKGTAFLWDSYFFVGRPISKPYANLTKFASCEQKVMTMLDIILLAIVVAFFGLFFAYGSACDHL